MLILNERQRKCQFLFSVNILRSYSHVRLSLQCVISQRYLLKAILSVIDREFVTSAKKIREF